MDLIIKKTKFNKNFFFHGPNSNSTNDDICYIKINMTLFNKTINSLDQDNKNNPRNRVEDKDIKFDIDKINLIQKNEINKTKVIDKEVLINNNLKSFLNSHIKALNRTNALKINSFIVKKLTNAIDNSISKKLANFKNTTDQNNTHNSSDSMVKVKKILNFQSNKSDIFIITNITNYTFMHDVMNSTAHHDFKKQIKDKFNDTNDNSNDKNVTKHFIKEKSSLEKVNKTLTNHSIYINKSNFLYLHF
jgi:hypothetical protein